MSTFINIVSLALTGWGGVTFVEPLAGWAGRPLLAPDAPWPHRTAAPYALAVGTAWTLLEERRAPRLGAYRVLQRVAVDGTAPLVVRVREGVWGECFMRDAGMEHAASPTEEQRVAAEMEPMELDEIIDALYQGEFYGLLSEAEEDLKEHIIADWAHWNHANETKDILDQRIAEMEAMPWAVFAPEYVVGYGSPGQEEMKDYYRGWFKRFAIDLAQVQPTETLSALAEWRGEPRELRHYLKLSEKMSQEQTRVRLLECLPDWYVFHQLHYTAEGGFFLDRAPLFQANLAGSQLDYADLKEAILRQADLRDADLKYSILWQADLREARLEGADLWMAANLPTALLEGARYDETTRWPENFDPSLQGAIRAQPSLKHYLKLSQEEEFIFHNTVDLVSEAKEAWHPKSALQGYYILQPITEERQKQFPVLRPDRDLGEEVRFLPGTRWEAHSLIARKEWQYLCQIDDQGNVLHCGFILPDTEFYRWFQHEKAPQLKHYLKLSSEEDPPAWVCPTCGPASAWEDPLDTPFVYHNYPVGEDEEEGQLIYDEALQQNGILAYPDEQLTASQWYEDGTLGVPQEDRDFFTTGDDLPDCVKCGAEPIRYAEWIRRQGTTPRPVATPPERLRHYLKLSSSP